MIRLKLVLAGSRRSTYEEQTLQKSRHSLQVLY